MNFAKTELEGRQLGLYNPGMDTLPCSFIKEVPLILLLFNARPDHLDNLLHSGDEVIYITRLAGDKGQGCPHCPFHLVDGRIAGRFELANENLNSG